MPKLLTTLLLLFCAGYGWSATNLSAIITIPDLGITNSTSIITIGTPRKVSSYTNRPSPLDTDLILLADPLNQTNANIPWGLVRSNLWNNVVLTNQASTISWPWLGPSNVFYFGTNDYHYVAVTPCAITGFVYSASLVQFSFLSVSNAASTNITFTVDDSVGIPVEDASRTYTITNGTAIEAYLEHKHGATNSVVKLFK